MHPKRQLEGVAQATYHSFSQGRIHLTRKVHIKVENCPVSALTHPVYLCTPVRKQACSQLFSFPGISVPAQECWSLAEAHPCRSAAAVPGFWCQSCAQGARGGVCIPVLELLPPQGGSAVLRSLSGPCSSWGLQGLQLQHAESSTPGSTRGLVCYRVKQIQDTEEKGGKERSKVVLEPNTPFLMFFFSLLGF